MSLWTLEDESLREEAHFQVELIRELKTKYALDPDLFELYLYKIAEWSYMVMTSPEEDTFSDEGYAVEALLQSLGPLFHEFSRKKNEDENRNV